MSFLTAVKTQTWDNFLDLSSKDKAVHCIRWHCRCRRLWWINKKGARCGKQQERSFSWVLSLKWIPTQMRGTMYREEEISHPFSSKSSLFQDKFKASVQNLMAYCPMEDDPCLRQIIAAACVWVSQRPNQEKLKRVDGRVIRSPERWHPGQDFSREQRNNLGKFFSDRGNLCSTKFNMYSTLHQKAPTCLGIDFVSMSSWNMPELSYSRSWKGCEYCKKRSKYCKKMIRRNLECI